MANLSDRLKQLRQERKLSQQALANAIKMSKSSINMYERGEREPGIETLKALADFFAVDIDYLIGKSTCRRQSSLARDLISLFDSMEEHSKNDDLENLYAMITNKRVKKTHNITIKETDKKKPAAETGDEPKVELNEQLHTMRVIGRNGKYEERQLTDEQARMIKAMFDALPKPQDGDL